MVVAAIKELYSKFLAYERGAELQARQIALKADWMALNAANTKIKKLESENAELKTRLDKIEKALNLK